MENTQSKSFTREIWEWGKAIVVAFLLAILIRTFLFAPTIVDGQSMMPTLIDRERLIVNKIIYRLDEPERGDIIVFQATEEKDFIKRVIGVAGDSVEMKDDTLYINGEVVPEPYLEPFKKGKNDPFPLTNDFGPITVPEGEIFVLGDNRRNSKDSRSEDVGTVPLDRVVGRADIAFWPISEIRILSN